MQALVIDDDPQVRRFVGQVLLEEGWEVREADSAERAFELLHEGDWSLVVCDVFLGGANGFDVLRRYKEELPETQVVLMTGHGSAEGALDAAAFGAYDYLLKPFGVEPLCSLLEAVRERILQRAPRGVLTRRNAGPVYRSDIGLVGRSEAFIGVMKQVGRVATTNLPVIVTGESGTGKGVVAAALHRRSQRAAKPFIALNCGAISGELIESELFGHVKGAFTGAHADRRGLWEEADGGTIFLDEITETSPAFQVKLLRVLQEGDARRVGSNQTHRFDVRVVAASNRDVEQEVAAGRFRQDLFYRLNGVMIHLPPLRERREDIFPLASSFAERVWSLNASCAFSGEALRRLEQYDWPGNIRELENAVVRAVALCGGVVQPEDLPERIRDYRPATGEREAEAENAPVAAAEEWPTLSKIEGQYVARVLEHTRGNKQAAARLLGIDRKTLERMLKRHQIDIGKAR
ncbi:MAG: sigma-54 dependent transcriptional regulator [Pyrinomonadaceae bacterium]